MLKTICIALVALMAYALHAEPLKKEVYFCKKTDSPLKIDGRLNDWWNKKPQPLALVKTENISISNHHGPKDMDVICYLLWDKQYLYLAAQISDDKHIAWLNSTMWMADSFQIAFDPKNDSVNEPRFGPDDIELNFSATDSGKSYADISAHGNAKMLGKVPGGKMLICYKRNKNDTGGIMETAIPWSMLQPIIPEKGKLFGFNVLYNERDSKIRRGWVSWTPGIGELKNAWFFNKVKLVNSKKKTSAQALITVNQQYFKAGDTAGIYCYIPYYNNDSPTAKLSLAVLDKGKNIYDMQKQLVLKQGMNRVEFAYKMGDTDELSAQIKINSKAFSVPQVLTASLKSLSAGELIEKAADIQKRSNNLRQLMQSARKQGVDTTYPEATLAVVDLFMKHRVNDLKSNVRLARYKYLDMIEKQLVYMDNAVTKTIGEVKLLMKNPALAKPVPTVDTTKLSIRRGQFRDVNGNAVMLLGPAGWDHAFHDIKFYKGMGFNLIGDTIIPGAVVPAPNRYISGYINSKKRHAQMAQENNMVLHFLCSPHPIPKGWLKAYPKMKGKNGFINATYYARGFREMIRQYWGRLVPALRDEPSLITWNVANEWFNYEGTRSLHPKMRVRFYNFLREKYDNIKALNDVWKTSYKRFDEIQPLEFRCQSQPGPYYDWEYFRQGEGLNVIKFFADTIRRYDPVTPLQIKIIADTDFGGGPFGRVGVEREDADDALDISGLDVGTAVNFNLLKSLHPNRPVMETEVHTSIHLKPEFETLRLWHTYLAGQSGRVMWGCVNSYTAEMNAAGAYLSIPWTMEAAARTGLDIRRLTHEVVMFQNTIAKAQVGILYSPVSRILEDKHLHTALKVFELISKLDAPVRFISEKQIKEGQLSSLKLLIVPDATFVHPETFKKIVQFAKSGRSVAVTGQSLTRDPYDNPYSAGKLTTAGVKSVDGKMNAETFDAIFNMAKVDRKFRILRTNGHRKENIETRIIKKTDSILAYIINRGPAQKLTFNFKCKDMVTEELISGRKLGREFKIEPSSVMMIRVRFKGKPQFTRIGGKTSVKLPAFIPEKDVTRRKLSKKEKIELETIRKKLLKFPNNNCSGRDDMFAVDGKAKYRSKPGIYVWWAGAGGQLKAGKYKAIVRLKVDNPPAKKVFTLCIVNQNKNKSLKQLTKVVSNGEYKEIELGEFNYDKTYMLRLSDWSSPGLWVDYVYLVPQK